MPNNPSREAFERWATSEDYSLQRRDTGEYRFVSTSNAWLGWQAGAQAERAKINAEHASKVPPVIWSASYE